MALKINYDSIAASAKLLYNVSLNFERRKYIGPLNQNFERRKYIGPLNQKSNLRCKIVHCIHYRTMKMWTGRAGPQSLKLQRTGPKGLRAGQWNAGLNKKKRAESRNSGLCRALVWLTFGILWQQNETRKVVHMKISQQFAFTSKSSQSQNVFN
jgi:hypothetical protein